MPVRHDGDDWIKLNNTVTNLVTAVERVENAQENQHRDNQARFMNIERDMASLSLRVTSIERLIARMEGLLEGLTTAAKALKWTVAIAAGITSIIMGLNTLFGPTIRQHLGLPNSLNHTPSGVSSSQQPESLDSLSVPEQAKENQAPINNAK